MESVSGRCCGRAWSLESGVWRLCPGPGANPGSALRLAQQPGSSTPCIDRQSSLALSCLSTTPPAAELTPAIKVYYSPAPRAFTLTVQRCMRFQMRYTSQEAEKTGRLSGQTVASRRPSRRADRRRSASQLVSHSGGLGREAGGLAGLPLAVSSVCLFATYSKYLRRVGPAGIITHST